MSFLKKSKSKSNKLGNKWDNKSTVLDCVSNENIFCAISTYSFLRLGHMNKETKKKKEAVKHTVNA